MSVQLHFNDVLFLTPMIFPNHVESVGFSKLCELGNKNYSLLSRLNLNKEFNSFNHLLFCVAKNTFSSTDNKR